ncbi:Cyclic nucleotide-binding protein [Pseudocohnilembus persalinus]|uniref:Cyclic nucleotide-binding protein n=1 Tax=Pseudocohnilembus persalinus TaxID=266149 RepID=A0A0V0R6H7_PSEPJ|nr:Cyclic nucleotide-binding protein [Pseudocohnilembus persalinus]|eukprot:KRX10116.1 Cyclic nucleotide-binding protein [Pseudocohnilembus persalinus]
MTTVGYGDFVPLTTAEKYFVVVTQIVSNSFFAYLLNFIGEIILEKSREKVVYKKQLTLLNKYLKKKNIEQDLQFQVRNYFAYQLKNQKELSYEEELQVFDSLSKDLKKRVTLDANLQLVKKLKFMNQFSKQTQEKLALVIQEIPFQENEIIYQEGEVDEDPCLYFIDSGEVQLYIESYKGEIEYTNFSLLKKGQYFGESSFVLNQARLISAKAIQMTRVFKLTRDTFLTIIKDDQHDLEIFSQIQYELLHGIQNKHFTCKICGENDHHNYVCPFTHLVVDKTKLILTYNQSTPHQNREPNPRNKLHKFNTLTNLKVVKECFDKFVKELFDDIQKIFGISSLGEDYIEFTTSQMDNNYSESNSFSSGSSSESVNFLQNSQVYNPEQQDLNEMEQQIYNQRIQQELEVIPEDYRQSQNDLNNQSSLKQYSNQNTLTNINNSEKSPITAKLRKRNKSKVNGFKPNRQFEFYGQVNPVIQSTSNDPFISASIHQNDNLNSEKTNNNTQDQNYAKNFLNRLGDKKKTQMLSKNFNTKLAAHNNVDSPLLNEKQNKQPFSQYKNINPQILQIPNNHFDMAGSQISVNSRDHSRPLSPHTHKHKNSKKQSLRNQQQQQFFNHQFYPNQIPFNQMQYPPQSPMQFSNQQSKFYKQYHQKNGRRPSIYNQNAQFQKLSLQQMQQFQLQQQQQQYQQQFNSPLLSNPYMQQQSMYYNSQFNPQNSFQNHGMDHYGMDYGQQSQFKKGKGLLDYSSMNQNSLMNRLNSKSLIKTSKIGNLTPVITKQQLKFQALENQQHQQSLMEQEKSQNSLFQVVHKEQILTPQQGFDSQQGILKDQDNVYSQQENIYQTQSKTIENVTILEKPTNFKYFYPEFNLNIEKMMEDYKLYKDREFPNYFGIYSYFNRFQLGDRKILKPKQSVKKSSFQVGDFNNFKGGKSKNFINSKVQNYLSELKKSKTPTLQLSKKL